MHTYTIPIKSIRLVPNPSVSTTMLIMDMTWFVSMR